MVTGMFITHIPYRGTGPQLTDLIGGRTQATVAGMPALVPHIRSGKLLRYRRGNHTNAFRPCRMCPRWQDVWAYKNFETSQWYGMHAPAGTPADIVARMQEECGKALSSKNLQERFAFDNAEGGGGPSSEYAKLHRERAKNLEGNRASALADAQRTDGVTCMPVFT